MSDIADTPKQARELARKYGIKPHKDSSRKWSDSRIHEQVRIRELEAELAEARKDTEIIEWLDKHKHKLDFQSGGGFVYAWEGRFRATVRELMRYDAAMKEDGR